MPAYHQLQLKNEPVVLLAVEPVRNDLQKLLIFARLPFGTIELTRVCLYLNTAKNIAD